ncbi:phosphoribosylanthranilate isomerase [Sulfuriferula nivalis]|uniref:N-(5'-phosphoribosyl)anthranilate isomerase n=1 Tax=Sulfuriferula nivalis TaxID=2675298 RepID=A0A809RSD8_9PROT|nr:phosphoribosylanthranilate isomerase [Sulfuriferula nivalis]BBP01791.1 N-(5'-phosphoribosyl)anthranilate isomerase [Sulfuriferula nivalis]
MRTRIKICGFTSVDAAVYAAQQGVDAIGLVFYPPSPRHVEIAQASLIARAVPAFVSSVALFVDADVATVAKVIEQVRPGLLQFHGNESPVYCRQFNLPYIKAVRVKQGLDLVQYALQFHDAQGILLDAYVAGEAGGTGHGFDWNLIPANLPLPLILSGGLDANNVGAAIRRTHPWAVDVSSGVEASKGIKDAAKVAQFIHEVNNAYR